MKPVTINNPGELEFASELIWQWAANDPETKRIFRAVLSNPELTTGEIFAEAFKQGITCAMVQMMSGNITVLGKGPGG